MFTLKINLDNKTSLVPKKLNKKKMQNLTDYLQNMKKEINVCESSDTRNFVGFAKKSSLIKIEDKIEKSAKIVVRLGTSLFSF